MQKNKLTHTHIHTDTQQTVIKSRHTKTIFLHT
jgi:hypothetical protein